MLQVLGVRSRFWPLLLLLLLLLLGGCSDPVPDLAADSLADLAAVAPEVSVSGLSSGAYMAVQYHVAFSEAVVGVGAVAGGPYYCSQGSLWRALTRCLTTGVSPSVAASVATTRRAAREGSIDALAGLAGDRVYLYGGLADGTVSPAVVAALEGYYRALGLGGQLRVVRPLGAGHNFPTLNTGVPCGASRPPFLGDCGRDGAGQILMHIYGDLAPRVAEPQGEWVAFDQRAFFDPDRTDPGLHATGYLYVPPGCREGRERCRLHIAFHGCRQSVDSQSGEAFIRRAGYNHWADNNRLIILYPQVATTRPWWLGGRNPRGCWDWWGYSDDDFHLQSGAQLAVVRRMVRGIVENGR